MKQVCPICHKNDAISDPYYGILPCLECRKRQEKLRKPGKQVKEFTSSTIKEQRKEFRKDTIQPFRNGELSKEYVDQWGTKAIKVDRNEVKKAKNVWKGSDAVGYYD